MKFYKNTSEFYKGEDWAKCKAQVLQERMKGDGTIYCEHCGQPIVKGFNPMAKNNARAMVFHHLIYLNNNNVNDASISINPQNIQILHWNCHNQVHERFGSGNQHIIEKKVWLITGAPCSGKTTFVKERMGENDLMLDIDDIWQMVSGKDRYIKPNALKPIVFKIRDEIKDLIARGAGTWRNAFIIESLPFPTDRARAEEKFKAFNVETITMDTSEEECIMRLMEHPSGRNVEEYTRYIKNYFESYRED